MAEKDRKIFINPESTGHDIINCLYATKKINTVIKNGIPINLKIHKNDLEVFDFIASKFGGSRSWLIAELLMSDINDMFNFFEIKPRTQLAAEADEEMTNKGMSHDFRGATWYWDVVRPDENIDNPGVSGLENLNGSKKNE